MNYPKIAVTTLLLGLGSANELRGGGGGSSSSEGRIRFIAVGDWGGVDHFPYHTEEQIETADGMAKIAAEQGSEFVLALGDNFYYSGLMDDDHAQMRFEQTFEKVYNQQALQVPWHIIGGNHDYCGDIQKQITIATDTSNRWSFPDLNYKISKEFTDENGRTVKLDIVMIDTMHIAGFRCVAEELNEEFFAQPPGPLSLVEATTTLSWIESALSESEADYLVVAGHYPIYSPCSHGNTDELIHKLHPLLKKYGVTAYISGHEHCQFHYAFDSMDYFLTGTGNGCCYAADNRESLPQEGDLKYLLADSQNYSGSSGVNGGFASFDVGADDLKIIIHRENGESLYETKLKPRAEHFKSSLAVALE